MRVGMAINSGHEAEKRELAAHFESAADLAAGVGLWFDGTPAAKSLRQLAAQIRENAEQAVGRG
jgi:hypothetical protein